MNLRPLVTILLGATIASYSVLCTPGGELRQFIDVPSGLIVLGGTLFFLLGSFTWKELRESLRISLLPAGSARPPQESVHQALRLFQAASRAAICFGVLGFFTGLLIMLMKLDNPRVIGTALAVSFISVLYSLFLAEICIQTLRIQCLRQLDPANASKSEISAGENGMAGMAILLLLTLLGTIPMVILLGMM